MSRESFGHYSSNRQPSVQGAPNNGTFLFSKYGILHVTKKTPIDSNNDEESNRPDSKIKIPDPTAYIPGHRRT
jgi:hypothetical protein